LIESQLIEKKCRNERDDENSKDTKRVIIKMIHMLTELEEKNDP